MFLARKITRSKWEKSKWEENGFPDGEIPADTITADLRTQGNTLSFWQCGEGKTCEIDDAALALATVADRVDKLDIVWVSDDDLYADGQSKALTEGRTHVTELIERHVDVTLLDHVRLGKIAHRIGVAIERGQCRRMPRKEVAKLIATAVLQGRVEFANLEDKVQIEVIKSLAQSGEWNNITRDSSSSS